MVNLILWIIIVGIILGLLLVLFGKAIKLLFRIGLFLIIIGIILGILHFFNIL